MENLRANHYSHRRSLKGVFKLFYFDLLTTFGQKKNPLLNPTRKNSVLIRKKLTRILFVIILLLLGIHGSSSFAFVPSPRPPYSPPSRPGFKPPARPAFFYNITATAGANGSISPSGDVTVNSGSNQVFAVTPIPGYKINQVSVDGSLQGTISSYTFSNVTTNHTISASFVLNNPTSTLGLAGYNTGATIDLGSIPSASRLTKSVTVTYSGAAPATQFFAVVSSGPFSIQSTTCGSSVSANCTINLAYMSNEVATETSTLSIGYFNGTASKQNDYILQGTSTLNSAQNVLIVYDQNNADSVEVKNYYLANRPGMKSASVLGVAVPQTSRYLTYGAITYNDFGTTVRAPVANWIKNNPNKTIDYIVLVYPFPSRIDDPNYNSALLSWPQPDPGGINSAFGCVLWTPQPAYPSEKSCTARSVATRLQTAEIDQFFSGSCNSNGCYFSDWYYNFDPNTQLQKGFLDPERSYQTYEYGDPPKKNFQPFASVHSVLKGSTALVTHLHMGSKDATKAYIDKLKSVHSQMANPNVIISGENAGIGGSTYYLEDYRNSTQWPEVPAKDAKRELLLVNPSASIDYRDSTSNNHNYNPSNVKGYLSWGIHGNLGSDYAVSGLVKFSGKSSWYIIETVESYNGMYYGGGPDSNNVWQGWFGQWYAKNAFGSTNYENTPVGSVGHTREPTSNGINKSNFFSMWEQGFLFADAAWASRSTETFIACGDPLTKK